MRGLSTDDSAGVEEKEPRKSLDGSQRGSAGQPSRIRSAVRVTRVSVLSLLFVALRPSEPQG